jgi:hypothetical protein
MRCFVRRVRGRQVLSDYGHVRPPAPEHRRLSEDCRHLEHGHPRPDPLTGRGPEASPIVMATCGEIFCAGVLDREDRGYRARPKRTVLPWCSPFAPVCDVGTSARRPGQNCPIAPQSPLGLGRKGCRSRRAGRTGRLPLKQSPIRKLQARPRRSLATAHASFWYTAGDGARRFLCKGRIDLRCPARRERLVRA